MSEHHPIRAYRAFLQRNSGGPAELVQPSGLGGLLLVIVGGVFMRSTGGWSLIVALGLVVVMMISRLAVHRRVEHDLHDLAVARKGFESTGDRRYLEVLRMQGERILQENRVLADPAKRTVEGYVSYARSCTERAEP